VVAAPLVEDPTVARAIAQVSDAVAEEQRNPIIPRSGVMGELFYRQRNGTLAALAPGAEDEQLLVVDNVPAWRSAAVHGDYVMTTAGSSLTQLAANWAYGILGSYGLITSTAATVAAWSPPLIVGDRAKSLTLLLGGDSAVDATITVIHRAANGTNVSLQSTTFSNVGPVSPLSYDFSDFTLAPGESIVVGVAANAANLTVYTLRLTYDHPA
jgi:hypothetical protein